MRRIERCAAEVLGMRWESDVDFVESRDQRDETISVDAAGGGILNVITTEPSRI
jgi:hypothetical protein